MLYPLHYILILLFFIASAQRIKHVTNDIEYQIEQSENTLTLFKPLDNCLSGLCIAAQINLYAHKVYCKALNGYKCFEFPQQAALVVTKTTPQLDQLHTIMKHNPKEHYFFILPPKGDYVNDSYEDNELASTFYSLKL